MTPDLDGLFDLMDWYFATYHEVHPSLARILWGVYCAYDPVKKTPAAVKIAGTKRTVPLQYFLSLYPDAPIFVGNRYDHPEDEDEHHGTFHVDRTWTWPYDTAEPRNVHLVTWSRLADPVVDDREELLRCGFPYAMPLAAMTREFRSSVYGKNLGEIHERPRGVDAAAGVPFLRALAQGGTYDARGDYFPKWRSGKENRPPYESNTSDRFLKQAFRELLLARDQIYVVITGPLGLVVYQIVDGPNGKRGRAYAGGIPESQYLDQASLKRAGKTPYEMWWVITADGLEEPPRHQKRKGREIPGDTSTIEVIDPKAMVLETLGKRSASMLDHREPFAWFVELVSLRFPDRFYVLDLSQLHNTWQAWNSVPLAASRNAVHPQILRAMVGDQDGAGTSAPELFSSFARAQVEAALADPTKLVLPQGLLTGRDRFIGVDDLYAYLRNLDSGLISVLPLSDYVTALAAGAFGEELYQSTQWIIPMSKAVAFGAAIAVGGWALSGMGATAAGIRTWAMKYVRGEVTTKVLREVAKRFGPALAAKLVELVLALWDDDEPKGGAAGAQGRREGASTKTRWRHFASGFFQGYVVQTLHENLYQKVFKLVSEGPKEYRLAVAIKKVYLAAERIQEVFARLEAELDQAAVQRATESFQSAAQHLIRGVGLLLTALYYVDHQQASSFFELFGKGSSLATPHSAEEWEAEATHQIARIAQLVTKSIDKFTSIDDLLEELRNNELIAAGAAMAVFHAQIWAVVKHTWKVSRSGVKKVPFNNGRKRKWAVYALVISAVMLIPSQTMDQIEDFVGEAVQKMYAIVRDVLYAFPGRSIDEARLFGKITGHLLGGVVLNNFLFGGEKSQRGPLRSPIVATTLKRNLKYGITKSLLAVIFKRYLSLYDRLVKQGVLNEARREEDFAALAHTFREEELNRRGMSHLMSFESEDENSMSLRELATALAGYHVVLREDGVSLLRDHYASDLARIKHDLEDTAKLGDELGLTTFAERSTKALFVAMNTHLRLAFGELSAALHALFEPFSTDGAFSWIILLKELGLDVGDVSGIQQASEKIFGDRLADFSAQSDREVH
ncbi:MAG: hypothetical protein R3B48_30645 [Kofleriaceae bacterium]